MRLRSSRIIGPPQTISPILIPQKQYRHTRIQQQEFHYSIIFMGTVFVYIGALYNVLLCYKEPLANEGVESAPFNWTNLVTEFI